MNVVRSLAGRIYKDVEIQYRLSFPKLVTMEKRPLLLFLHGMGERHDDPSIIKDFCITKMMPDEMKEKFIVMTPLCPPDDTWRPDAIKFGIDEVCKSFPIDTNRIYGTGYSMGGRGLWDTATEYPDLFAAICPIAGYTSYGRAERIAKLPCWAVHGEKDVVVPAIESKKMIEAMRAAGGKPRLSILSGYGHYGWNEVYGYTTIYNWFLENTKDNKINAEQKSV